MHRRSVGGFVALGLALLPAGAATSDTLTLEEALALARERSPQVLVMRARFDEAQSARRAGAMWMRANPALEAAVGKRRSDQGDSGDLEFSLRQTFELGGNRGARIAAGDAEVSRAQAASDTAVREVLRDTARFFLHGLHAQRLLEIARESEAVARDVLRMAEIRHTRGDAAILEVNVARAALGRARADASSVGALREAAVGELRRILGTPPRDSLILAGDLRGRKPPHAKDWSAHLEDLPAIRSLEAEVDAARAMQRLGRARAWPELSLGSGFAREEDAEIVFGTLGIDLPLFDRGQGLRGEAAARLRRAQLELEVARRTATLEVHAAERVLAQRLASVEALEREALPLLDANEALARRSYEAGQIGLVELLLVRREVLETRIEYLDHVLEAAIAGIELEATAGVLR